MFSPMFSHQKDAHDSVKQLHVTKPHSLLMCQNMDAVSFVQLFAQALGILCKLFHSTCWAYKNHLKVMHHWCHSVAESKGLDHETYQTLCSLKMLYHMNFKCIYIYVIGKSYSGMWHIVLSIKC